MTESECIIGLEYIFVGDKQLIEKYKEQKQEDENIILLGKFIEYKDVIYWGDILSNAIAIFENGNICSGHYDKIKNKKQKIKNKK